MKGTARLAMKNLGRYRKRTAITALALGVGLGLFIWMDAWLKGAEIESERNLVWYETASLRVVTPAWWDKKDQLPLGRHLTAPAPILDSLRSAGFKASPRIQFSGEMIFHEGDFPSEGYLPVRLVAVDPASDDQVFRLAPTLSEGRWIQPGADEVILGSWLAADIGATLGAPLTIKTRDVHGYTQTLDLVIVGFVTTDNPTINRGSLFLPLDVAQYALDMEGKVTEINIALDDYRDAPSIQPRIQELTGPGLRVLTWQDLAADYLAISSTKQGGSKIILFLVIIIAAVGISNTMLMAVFERIREVGMLQALGMTRAEIRSLFLWESAGIGILGGLAGLVLGTALTVPMVVWGVDFSFLLRDMDVGYRIAGVMRAAWNPPAMVQAFVFAVGLSVAVASLTLRKMLSWTITQALTHQ